ncbi:MAG: hypothetical protein U0168_06780 [Nannocystaceae bacterium]|jgi:hypothetical protein
MRLLRPTIVAFSLALCWGCAEQPGKKKDDEKSKDDKKGDAKDAKKDGGEAKVDPPKAQ